MRFSLLVVSRAAALAIALVALAPAAASAMLVPMDVDALAKAADAVVVVHVSAAHSRALVAGEPRKGIVTDNALHVGRVLAGSRPADITLTQEGGEVDGLGLALSDQATFTPGEQCVVFLDKDGRVTGGSYGKLEVVGGRVPELGLSVNELARRIDAVRSGEVPDPLALPANNAPRAETSAPASVDTAGATVLAAAIISPAAVPTIGSITPDAQIAGLSQTVTISGSGFGAAGGKVEFADGLQLSGGRRQATVQSWSDTSLVVVVPQYACAGPLYVTTADSQVANKTYNVGFSTAGRTWSAMPISYRINENTADTVGEGAEIQAAFATWSAAGTKFKLGYAGTCTTSVYPTPSTDGYNDVFFSNSAGPSANALAVNRYWYSGNTIIESDITLFDSKTWATSAVGSSIDIQSVVLHELGHTVGLDDQYPNSDRTMGAYYGVARRTIGTNELAGALYLYGADVAAPTAPTVASSTHPSQTTWYATSSASLTFSATAGAGIAGYSYAVDGSAATDPDTVADTAAGSVTLTPGEGERWFHVRAVAVGGAAGPTTHYRLRSDTTAPAGTVQVGPVGTTYVNSTSVAITTALSDAGSGVGTMRIDPGTGTYGSWTAIAAQTSATLSGADGARTVSVQARDALGNTRTDSRQLVLDRAAPATTDDVKATYDAAATITLSGSDALAGVGATYWGLDAPAARTYTGPITVATEGAHTLNYYSVDAAGNAEPLKSIAFTVDLPSEPQPAVTTRLSGADRFVVAANAGQTAFPGWAGVTDVIIASGEDKAAADPLSASGLAGAYHAPVLLVSKTLVSGKVHGATENALTAIRAANGGKVNIHVVGGPMYLPDAVYKRLAAQVGAGGSIERITGADRYDLSAQVANRAVALIGPAQVQGALIANGENPAAFYDTLAASPIAYATQRPLLMVQGSKVPGSIANVLSTTFAGKPRVAVSSTAYLSAGVVSAAGASERMATSSDRIVAASQIAELAVDRGWLGCADVAVANKLPDALTGGSALGELGGPLLYTDASALSATTSGWLAGHSSDVLRAYVVGGEKSVAPSAFNGVAAALQ